MTHKQRVLDLLSDGKPHSHHELYALHVIAHSRIADLRRDGHPIEQWRGDDYLYRLLDTPPREGDAGQSSPVSGGWVSAQAPGATAAGGHDLNVAPRDSTGDASSTAEPVDAHDGGGIPGSAPNADTASNDSAPGTKAAAAAVAGRSLPDPGAEQTSLFRVEPPRERWAA